MNEITVRIVAIKMGVSPQAIYKRLDGREATPANIAQVLRDAANTLRASAKINNERAVEYIEMAHHIEDRIQEKAS